MEDQEDVAPKDKSSEGATINPTSTSAIEADPQNLEEVANAHAAPAESKSSEVNSEAIEVIEEDKPDEVIPSHENDQGKDMIDDQRNAMPGEV